MYIIKKVKIIGVTSLKVNVKTSNIEEYRKECAEKYNVKLSDVKFIYEDRY